MTNFARDVFSSGRNIEEECERRRRLVEHVRTLLERADARRLAEPDKMRHWNRVLDNLETALDEAKARYERLERQLVQNRGNSTGHDSGASVSPILHAAEESADLGEFVGGMDAEAAAQYLLDTPLEAVEDAPLEQVALARNHLALREQAGLATDYDKLLAGRIELAIQGRSASLPSALDRRQQESLRTVVQMILANKLDEMTLKDLELAIGSYAILIQRLDCNASEERLKEILGCAVREVERLFACLRRDS